MRKKKLGLSRETVRLLDDELLDQVQGGAYKIDTTTGPDTSPC